MTEHPRTRVVHLESGGWGGLAHYVYSLGQALVAAGCDVTLQTKAPFELDALPRDFTVRTFEDGHSWSRRWIETQRSLESGGAKILHLQSTISARRDWLSLAGLRARGTRVVVTAHNVLPHDKEEREARGMRFAFGRIYGGADAVIVHGEATREELMATFDLPAERVHVIPLGEYGFVVGEHERRASREQLGIDTDAFVLLAFGAMRDYKGIPDLIEAFSSVADDHPHARLVIVGKPIRIDPAEYRRQIDDAGLSDRVDLRAEYVPMGDVGLYLAAADVGVYPYKRINQSAALQLAYGAGLPVVATAVGELTASVEDGVNGVLAAPSDPVSLAGALRRMLAFTDEERARMGRRSRQLAARNHSWQDAAEMTAALYRRLRRD